MDAFMNYTDLLHIGTLACSRGYDSIVEGVKTATISLEALDHYWGESILKCTSIVCTFICFFCLVGGFLTCIYRKLRQGTRSSANCWFCNATGKFSYPQRNALTCPSCKEFNGFTSDGGYNKQIIAQFFEVLNPPAVSRGLINRNRKSRSGRTKSGIRTAAFNGLCNLNQELKVLQLSSFVPTSEVKAKELEIEKLEEKFSLLSL